MDESCPIPTPEQRIASAVLDDEREVMFEKIRTAINEADIRVRERLVAVGSDVAAPPIDYYQHVAQRRLYRILCGATNGDSFDGGNGDKAISIIRGLQLIAKEYWGADVDVYPRQNR